MFTPLKAVVTALVLATAIAGQTPEPALKPAGQPRQPESTPPLKLEIRYNAALPPAYLDVRGASEERTWIWVTRFVKTAGTQISPNIQPVRAVKFETQFNGETTNVRVTVFRGTKGFESEDLVGEFKLGVGEHRLVSDLSSFQIEPIDIAISDTPSALPSPPAFDLRTGAIEIVSTESESTPLPAYRIKFRNVSPKAISALQISVVNGPTALLQGTEGRALIEAGAVHEEYLPLPQSVDRGAFGEVHTVTVSSAVFDDGSYDGAVEPACLFESLSVGRAFWLKSVLPLFDEQIANENAQAWEGAAKLKQRVAELKVEIPQALAIKSSSVSSSCASPGLQIEQSFNAQRLRLLRELDQIISTRPAPPIDFTSWLRTTRNSYADWSSRLSHHAAK